MSPELAHPVCSSCSGLIERSGDDENGRAYQFHDCAKLDIRVEDPDWFYCGYYWPRRKTTTSTERGAK